MKRSLSQSFKGKKGCHQNKQLIRAQSSFGFKTVWKFRNCHQSTPSACENVSKKEIRISKASFAEGSISSQRRISVDNNDQTEIKAYIKNMKGTEKKGVDFRAETRNKDNKCNMSVSRISSQAFIETENEVLLKLEMYEKKIEELIKLKLLKKGPNYFCMSRNTEDEC